MAVAVAAGFDESPDEPPQIPKDIADLLTRAVQGDEEASVLLPDRIYGVILKAFGEGWLTLPTPNRDALIWGIGAGHLPAEEQNSLASVCADVLQQMSGASDRKERILRAFARLAEKQPRLAQILDLRFREGLTEQEIADRLKVSVLSIKLNWRHALGRIAADS